MDNRYRFRARRKDNGELIEGSLIQGALIYPENCEERDMACLDMVMILNTDFVRYEALVNVKDWDLGNGYYQVDRETVEVVPMYITGFCKTCGEHIEKYTQGDEELEALFRFCYSCGQRLEWPSYGWED